MSRIIVKIDSKANQWLANKRYKVGESVLHNGVNYVNITGANNEPGVGSDWKSIGSENVSEKELFTATNLQTDFVLNSYPNNVDVIIDRVQQIETIDYTFSGNTVVLAEGAELDSKVEIRKF